MLASFLDGAMTLTKNVGYSDDALSGRSAADEWVVGILSLSEFDIPKKSTSICTDRSLQVGRSC